MDNQFGGGMIGAGLSAGSDGIDPRRDAIMALGAGLLGGRGNFGQRMAQGVESAMQARNMGQQMQMRQALGQAQLQQYQAAAAEQQRKREMAERQAQAQQAFYGGLQGGPDGKIALTQADVLRGISAGISPDDIKAMAESGNWGRNKVGREVTVAGPDGSPQTVLMDEYGGQVGGPLAQPVKLDRVDTGSQVLQVNPYQAGAPISKTMTPGERASNAIAQANLGMRQQEFAASRAAAGTAGVPSGYRRSADGNLEFIPGGPADPANARRAAPTEFQAKASGFAARAAQSDAIINELATQGVTQPGMIKRAMEGVPVVGGALGTMANITQSAGQQRVEQAQRDFVNSILRQESGAAIGADEFDNARKQYFPQPGDSQAVMRQKAANRQLAIRGLTSNAGPAAFESPRAAPAAGPAQAGGASGGWSSIGGGDAAGWSAQEVR